LSLEAEQVDGTQAASGVQRAGIGWLQVVVLKYQAEWGSHHE
jgi:hypothetical protein